MTKKDYVAIAKQFKEVKEDYLDEFDSKGYNRIHSVLVARVATVLQNDSPRFDYDKFIEACQ